MMNICVYNIYNIDKDLIRQNESETRYWRYLLRIIIYVITFVCERALLN